MCVCVCVCMVQSKNAYSQYKYIYIYIYIYIYTQVLKIILKIKQQINHASLEVGRRLNIVFDKVTMHIQPTKLI